MQIVINSHHSACVIGYMDLLSIDVKLTRGDRNGEAQYDKLEKQTNFLASIFPRICENEKINYLSDYLKNIVFQRVEFINNCAYAIKARSQDSDLSNILILIKKSSDMFVEIDNILTYAVVRDENANKAAAEHKELMKHIGEIIGSAATTLKVPKEIAEGVLMNKMASGEMLKDVASEKVNHYEESKAEEYGAFSYLTKKIAEQYYNAYHQNSVPSSLKSVECHP